MLTPEQEKQVEVIREQRAAADILSHQTYASQLKNLLAIVDDLRKQLPKQYTESDLHIGFHKTFPPFEGSFHKQILRGWLACARFMGAIKE